MTRRSIESESTFLNIPQGTGYRRAIRNFSRQQVIEGSHIPQTSRADNLNLGNQKASAASPRQSSSSS